MSGFVGEDTNDFVWRFGIEKGARIDEDVPAVHDEGVKRAITKHHDPHVLFGQSGGTQNGLRVVA